ncbi:uncharacterized protein LOC116256974 [Nymphaea colorata]|nr:uncharacterized protein LOC116256974 [Nymphaea colorata]XP_031489393.1 uncharacterized protein LOC116256974 [Nymphaea colorata]
MADLSRVRTSLASQERSRGPLLCPKPRRLAIINHAVAADAVRPFRSHLNHSKDQIDSKAGLELLDILFAKGVYGGDQTGCGSPPYFCGSPPSRSANPLVHDARFTEGRKDLSPVPFPLPAGFSSSPASSSPSSSSPSSARKGCARATFGHKPAAVRIEGFDCLDRDRRGCSIPAVA